MTQPLARPWMQKKPTVSTAIPRTTTGRASARVSQTPTRASAQPAGMVARRPMRSAIRPDVAELTEPRA